MFHVMRSNGHTWRPIARALTLVSAAVLIQCAHGQPGTGEQPSRLAQPPAAEARVFSDCPGCPEMVEIPGGTFRMGTNSWRDDTKPAHTVTVRPFAMGLREVSRDEYAAFAAATGRTPPGCPYRPYDNGAARCLTWHDAKAYTEWLGHRTGRPYRLPSESEWEYVARGSDLDGVSKFGVQDLFTGVGEWLADCFLRNYVGAPADGSPWDPDPECSNRVIRGYAWTALWTTPNTTSVRRKRAALRRFAMDRQAHPPQRTTSTLGVRVARSLFDSP